MPVYMALKTCPRCGAPVEPGQNSCPNCRAVLKKKSALTPYLVIAGLIVVVIIVVAFVLMSPAPGPGTTIAPVITVQPTSAGTNAGASLPSQPTCFIDITPSKVSSSLIRLQVTSTTCSPGELTGLNVSINGAQAGPLGTNPGASRTFTGSSGTNSVVVTANFANGAESVVLNTAL